MSLERIARSSSITESKKGVLIHLSAAASLGKVGSRGPAAVGDNGLDPGGF